MLQIILMLLGLAFGNNNGNATCNNNGNNITTMDAGSGFDPGTGTDPDDGTGGPVGGNTGQIPPPFTKP